MDILLITLAFVSEYLSLQEEELGTDTWRLIFPTAVLRKNLKSFNAAILQFHKKKKLYIRATYIVFLFVKSENNNFIKEIEDALCALIT